MLWHLAAALAVAGIIGVSVDSTIWYLGAIGLFLATFGWRSLQTNLSARSAEAFRISLLLFWALAAVRWTFCDEIVLAVWIYMTGGYIARKLYADRRCGPEPA
ncbi:hypothetical protein EON81_15295 [bacterium]|nr:MAG: hypothetical protein EON81_15295 [bacterium]